MKLVNKYPLLKDIVKAIMMIAPSLQCHSDNELRRMEEATNFLMECAAMSMFSCIPGYVLEAFFNLGHATEVRVKCRLPSHGKNAHVICELTGMTFIPGLTWPTEIAALYECISQQLDNPIMKAGVSVC